MPFKTFVGESGLKVLAMARLSQCEYSLMLYLLNCAASGLDELITTEQELSSLIGYDEREIAEAAEALADRNMIRVRLGTEHHDHPHERQSMRIGLQFDMSQWSLNFDEDVSSHDAIVFPFRRGANLHIVGQTEKEVPSRTETTLPHKGEPTWKRVLESFIHGRDFDDSKMDLAERDAKILVDTHPVDQVLLMLRHFGQRIPTLSLLASSWKHYQEIFEQETQKVDIMGARQKHCDLDIQLRKEVKTMLTDAEDLGLSGEEVTVLEILYKHNHPRRQLFWAYQSRGRYPSLKGFFSDNAHIMLPVTSSGIVVKKKPHQD